MVKDTGIGIPDFVKPRLFQEFGMEDNQQWNMSGTGLGLAICRKILNEMGGDI